VNKNSPTVTHACRKRRIKWVPGARWYNWATLPRGDINTEAWSSRMGVGRGTKNLPCKKKIVEKPPRNSAGFCGGGQGLSWVVEPGGGGRERKENYWTLWTLLTQTMILLASPLISNKVVHKHMRKWRGLDRSVCSKHCQHGN
jgi:hypothetical protein